MQFMKEVAKYKRRDKMNRDEFLKATCLSIPDLSEVNVTDDFKLMTTTDDKLENEILSFYEGKHFEVHWEIETENKTEMDDFFERCIIPALWPIRERVKKYLKEGYEIYIPDSYFTIGHFKPSLNTKIFNSEKGFCWRYSEAYNISNEGQGEDTYGDGALIAKIDIRLRKRTKKP